MLGLLASIFTTLGLAVRLIARGLWRILTLAARALRIAGVHALRALWWVIRVALPALGRGARGVGRWAWPKLVVAFALLGYGAVRAGTWVRRKFSRPKDLA